MKNKRIIPKSWRTTKGNRRWQLWRSRTMVTALVAFMAGMVGVHFMTDSHAASLPCGTVSSPSITYQICLTSAYVDGASQTAAKVTAQSKSSSVQPKSSVLAVQKCDSQGNNCTNVINSTSNYSSTGNNSYVASSGYTRVDTSVKYYKACAFLADTSGWGGGGCSPATASSLLITSPPPTPNPSPNPSPSPSPKPSSNGSKSSSSSSTKKSTGSTSSGTSSPTTPPTNNNDGQVTAGTVAASINFSSDNIATARIEYGTDPSSLTFKTDDQQVNNEPSTDILVSNLQPLTTYTYRIVRTNAAGSTASGTQTFTTVGFDYSAHFTLHGKNISGISVTMAQLKTTVKTDKNGNATFHNVPSGFYTLSYSYNKQTHTQKISIGTDTIDVPANSDASVLKQSDTIKLDAFVTGNTQSSSAGVIIVVVILFLLAIAGLAFFLIRRRNNRLGADYADAGTYAVTNQPALPAAPPVPPPLPPGGSALPVGPTERPANAPHAGESLRDLVVQDLARKAIEKQKNEPDDNIPK